MCIIDHYPLGNQRTEISGGLNSSPCAVQSITLFPRDAGCDIMILKSDSTDCTITSDFVNHPLLMT